MPHEWLLLQYAKQREKEIFIAVRGEYYLNHSMVTGKKQPNKLLVSLGCALQSRNGSEGMNCRNQMT
jgi:hypothetical protein